MCVESRSISEFSTHCSLKEDDSINVYNECNSEMEIEVSATQTECITYIAPTECTMEPEDG